MVNEATKLELIAWLAMLEDQKTVDILKSIKDSQSDDTEHLSDLEIKAIEEGMEDIDKGRVISREEFKVKYGL